MEKVRVAVLGSDHELLEKMCEKMNSSRPIDISFSSDLKTFFARTVSNPPDIIGISLSFPHKSINQFPKVLRLALNIPVIVFGEDQNPETRKKISSSSANYKISGQVNAHNLWVKILNCQKELQEEENEKTNGSKELQKNKNNSVFLKGSAPQKTTKEKNNLLNSLYAAIDGKDSEDEKEKKKLSIVKSTSATKYNAKNTNHINTVDTKDLGLDESEEKSSNFQPKEKDQKEEGVESSLEKKSSQAGSELHFEKPLNTMGDKGYQKGSEKNKEQTASQDFEKNKKEKKAEESNNSSKNKESNVLPFEQNKKSLPTEDNQKENEGKSQEIDLRAESEGSQNKEGENSFDENKKKKNQEKEDNHSLDQELSMPSSEQEEDKKKRDEVENKEQKKPSLNPNKTSALKPKENRKSEAEEVDKNKKEEESFGKVKLSDEKEIKANEKKRNKEKEKKQDEKKQSVLQEACELALSKVFGASQLKEARPFDTQSIQVFVVELDQFKGFLLLANSFNQDLKLDVSDDFRMSIIDHLKANGISSEIGQHFDIVAKTTDYVSVVNGFSDFVIDYEEDSGKQQIVSFVRRELVKPKFDESDREGMFFIDIKVIPPRTIVNFDAFLYLPKNKRFVRYLKEGSCLSLEQAKRHTEVLKTNRLYLPKDNKQKFIQFFVQNTIDWELTIHSKVKVS